MARISHQVAGRRAACYAFEYADAVPLEVGSRGSIRCGEGEGGDDAVRGMYCTLPCNEVTLYLSSKTLFFFQNLAIAYKIS